MYVQYRLLYVTFTTCVFVYLLVIPLTDEDNSLALKKKVTVEDVFGPDLRIHDPGAKWISGE